jgi:transposase-like protein
VLLVVLGVRQDGQKVLLAVKNMGGETSQAWRTVLDDLVKRGLRQPEFLIVAMAGLGWSRRCLTTYPHPIGDRANQIPTQIATAP